MNLLDSFLARVEERPDAAAIVTPRGHAVTYAALARASAARAEALRRAGIGRGDVVLIARGLSPALYESLLAVFRLGAVALFPEPSAGLAGLGHAIAAAAPKAFCGTWPLKLLRPLRADLRALRVARRSATATGEGPLASLPGDAPALITFTSGSTGRPRGVVRSVDFLMLQHWLLEELRRTRAGDVDLISLPVFVLSNLLAGATSVIPAGRLTRPAALDGHRLRRQILSHGVNRVIAPPAVCARLIESGGPPLATLSAVFTGGGPVWPNLLRGLGSLAPAAQIHAVYGSTEAEPIAHLRLAQVSEADFDAMAQGGGLLAGRPIAQIETGLVDGELWVAGPHVNRGYLDPADDQSTKAWRGGTLWHRTGDAARFDGAGRLWLLGRASASTAGLHPFACEAAALSWPGVRQAALVAGSGAARLAVAGERLDLADLTRRAAALGPVEVVAVAAVPMDRRHNSKVDYPRLRRLLG